MSPTFTDEQLIAAIAVLYPDRERRADGLSPAPIEVWVEHLRKRLEHNPRVGYAELHQLAANLPESLPALRSIVALARAMFPDLCGNLGDFEVWDALRGKPESRCTQDYGDLERVSRPA